MELREIIGEALWEKRWERGLTQMALAERMGVRSRDISRIERGGNVPTAGFLISAASALGCSVDELLGRPRPAPEQPARFGVDARELLRSAVRLTHPDRHPPERSAVATRVTQDLNAEIQRLA